MEASQQGQAQERSVVPNRLASSLHNSPQRRGCSRGPTHDELGLLVTLLSLEPCLVGRKREPFRLVFIMNRARLDLGSHIWDDGPLYELGLLASRTLSYLNLLKGTVCHDLQDPEDLKILIVFASWNRHYDFNIKTVASLS